METPRSETFDDIYFAVEDGLAESRYVFLEQNHLPEGWSGRERFTICETGFGTGLNFLCVWSLFEKTVREDRQGGPQGEQQLTYISFEKYPLSIADISKYLDHWRAEFGGRLERLCEVYPPRIHGWHKIRVSDRVTLLLIFDDVNRALPQLDHSVDCWFLDGHAPAKNPDMWSQEVFSAMGRLSHAGARVATFTSAGFVKRGLQGAGFEISKVKGFGRKREMLTGVFVKEGAVRADPVLPRRVAVIGGGVAGAAAVYSVCQRGINVDLFEKGALASGASGNVRGLFNPRFTAQQGNESDFYSAAFSHALRVFTSLSGVGLDLCGSLHLITDEAKRKRFGGFLQSWGWHEDHARLVPRDEVQEICGIPVLHDAVFLPHSGLISPARVVPALAAMAHVIHEEVTSLEKIPGGWSVNGRLYDAVILCGAYEVLNFAQTAFLPLQRVRGQVSVIKTPEVFSNLECNLCYGGYASRPFEGRMVVGSTFQPWLDDPELREDDHEDVLRKLSAVVGAFDGDAASVVGGRTGFRCAAKDRVPVIGAVPEQEGLYLSVAHGSHGLTTALQGAEILAAQICGEIAPVPQNVGRYLSPSRFF